MAVLNPKIDRTDPITWRSDNWPSVVGSSIFHAYNAGHAQFMWDVRCENKVIKTFAKVWKTHKLLVSFDSFGVMKPSELTGEKYEPSKRWYHTDQAFSKTGRCCVQGFVNLEKTGSQDGSLLVYKNSHKYQTQMATKFGLHHHNKDWYRLTPEQEQWLKEQKGVEEVKVLASKGDMVLWDSRTIHCNTLPDQNRQEPRFRYVCYICMVPASFVTIGQLKNKKEAFDKMLTTGHWPQCTKIFKNQDKEKNQKHPLRLSEIGKKLAGLVLY